MTLYNYILNNVDKIFVLSNRKYMFTLFMYDYYYGLKNISIKKIIKLDQNLMLAKLKRVKLK